MYKNISIRLLSYPLTPLISAHIILNSYPWQFFFSYYYVFWWLNECTGWLPFDLVRWALQANTEAAQWDEFNATEKQAINNWHLTGLTRVIRALVQGPASVLPRVICDGGEDLARHFFLWASILFCVSDPLAYFNPPLKVEKKIRSIRRSNCWYQPTEVHFVPRVATRVSLYCAPRPPVPTTSTPHPGIKLSLSALHVTELQF